MLGVALVSTAYLAWYSPGAPLADAPPPPVPSADDAAPAAATQYDAQAVRRAYARQARGLLLEVEGVVERTLADDRDGSPHQRFIIRTESGITLLVAHNLDLAPRLSGLAEGDRVRAYGEYEWNPQGGVLHWTHDDPAGQHPAGWIDWQGRRYQ